MSNPQFTNRKLVVAISPDYVVQAAHDTAIPTAELTYRQPQTTPAFHSNVAFRDEERSCDARFVIIEELTGKIARFTWAWRSDAKNAAGMFAYLQGIAGAPTGTPANETQTINLGGATGGTATFELDFEGKNDESSSVATTAALTAAAVQTALENNDAIRAGNVSVTGSAGGPFTVTFIGRLANANIPLMTVNDSSTGGSGVVVSAGTNGANKTQLITRTTSEKPVQFSLVEGFDGETNGTKLYKNIVLDSWTANINRRGKLGLTVVGYGDPIPDILSGYSMPACSTTTPVGAKDTRLLIGSEYVLGDLRELTITESNNIDVSEDALKGDDITPDQLQSGDPTASVNALILGSPTSDLYAFAEDENNAFDSLSVAMGRPGERFTYIAPNTQFRLEDNLIEFIGTRNVSAFRLLGRPSPDGSNVVSRGEYHGAYTGQFLLTS